MIKDSDMICNKCNEKGCLVLQMAAEDYVCEWCGQWQDFILNDIWYPINYSHLLTEMAGLK